MMVLYICFDPDSNHYKRGAYFAIIFRAPLYVVFAEFKLLMTPLYKLVIPTFILQKGDRIKHDFFSLLIVHGLLESFPMLCVQLVNCSEFGIWTSVAITSIAFSLINTVLAVFVIHTIKEMHLGGQKWLNPDLPMYLERFEIVESSASIHEEDSTMRVNQSSDSN